MQWPSSSWLRRVSRWRRAYADLIANGIDSESVGNRIVDAAVGFVDHLRDASPKITPMVILPPWGVALEEEDALFLALLASGDFRDRLRLVCCDSSAPALPQTWDVEWSGEGRAVSSTASATAEHAERRARARARRFDRLSRSRALSVAGTGREVA